AGVYAMSGMKASENAQKVLEENGIFHHHQSTALTENEVEWATLILTMTTGHKNTLIGKFPNAKQKTYTLKEFASEKMDDIVDPFGGMVDIYRKTFIDIQENIEKLVGKLDSFREDHDGEKEG